MNNPNKINGNNNLLNKWWLRTKASELFNLFSKKESNNDDVSKRDTAKDDVEKDNLLHKNWDKVVIARSNWEPVLWVIIGYMRWHYKVAYNVGDEVKEKDLSEKKILEDEKLFADTQLEIIEQDGPDYKIWEEVFIPRTNREPSKAYIVGYNEKTWKYNVWFADRKEVFSKAVSRKAQGKNVEDAVIIQEKLVWKSKTLTKEDLDKYNS